VGGELDFFEWNLFATLSPFDLLVAAKACAADGPSVLGAFLPLHLFYTTI